MEKKQINLRLPVELIEELDKIQKKHGDTTRNSLIVRLLYKEIKREEKNEIYHSKYSPLVKFD